MLRGEELNSVMVSIHASRCREAMLLHAEKWAPALLVSIHASRCREAMPQSRLSSALLPQFQSTPPVAGRRCRKLPAILATLSSFNPRLPLPGGDAGTHRIKLHRYRCFNPRLPLPGGDA